MTVEGVASLELAIADLRAVLDTLDEEEWAAQSGCAGWRTQDLVAHLGSNLKQLVEPAPPSDPPPDLRAEELMELMVEPRKSWTAAEVHDEFERYADAAVAVLWSMQEEPAASAPVTLAELGTWPAHQLADAYAFDGYCHLRSDLLAPRGSVHRQVLPPDDARLSPVIGWMLLGLPQMCRDALAFVERPVGLLLDGPGGGAWTMARGDGLLEVQPGLADPAVTVRSTSESFVDWATRRATWKDQVTLDGDAVLGERVCDALDIV